MKKKARKKGENNFSRTLKAIQCREKQISQNQVIQIIKQIKYWVEPHVLEGE